MTGVEENGRGNVIGAKRGEGAREGRGRSAGGRVLPCATGCQPNDEYNDLAQELASLYQSSLRTSAQHPQDPTRSRRLFFGFVA